MTEKNESWLQDATRGIEEKAIELRVITKPLDANDRALLTASFGRVIIKTLTTPSKVLIKKRHRRQEDKSPEPASGSGFYSVWIKIDETLPWIELKKNYQTREEAKKGAEDFLHSMQMKVVRTPTRQFIERRKLIQQILNVQKSEKKSFGP